MVSEELIKYAEVLEMKELSWLTLLFITLSRFATGDTNVLDKGCVPAYSKINTSLQEEKCHAYTYPKDGICNNIVTKDKLVFGNESLIQRRNQTLNNIMKGKYVMETAYQFKISKTCIAAVADSYCRWVFPKCDQTSDQPLPKPLCRETCEYTLKTCPTTMNLLKTYNSKNQWHIFNCSKVSLRNGGDIPECYYSRHLNNETDKLKANACYYGNGLGYRGDVNITRSGYICQSWSSQCPHRHDHPLSEYLELVNASNWCRNPGGQGPNGPWCYTTNSSIRWEYCDVEKCPPPAPTKAPVILQAYSPGPNTIFISWNKVPLSFMHSEPRGFQIIVEKFDEDEVIDTTLGPNTTSFENHTLQALTNYSISVLAFNDAGDGPLSRVYVKTMPEKFVAVRYALTMNRNSTDYIRLIDNNAKTFKKAGFKKMIWKLFDGEKPSGYHIYQIRILSFINSSYEVEFVITAGLNERPSWSAAQEITGRILTSFAISKAFEVHSLLVKGSPPPPANLSNSDVDQTSLTVNWSAPLYHGPYRITNYTVQYKKAGTDMKYYDAVKVKSNVTKAKVNSLDSNTKYLMRVKSFNDYGSKATEPMEIKTLASKVIIPTPPILAIALTSSVIVVLMVVTGLAFWRWWYKKRKENKVLKDTLQNLRDNPYESDVDWFGVLKIKITKQWWEIPRDDLALDEQLGSGAFGVVMKGYLTKSEEGEIEDRIVCAVKMLQDNPTEQELRDLCNEINVMSSVGEHPNLVNLIGACTINGPPMLVVKFAPNGCLHDYLKDSRPLPDYQNTCYIKSGQIRPKQISEKERMRFAYDIAQGMAHLERNRFLHRDLAARNVLLGENMVAMVSDFGLSRDIYESGAYESTTGGFLPVRWMALESLQDYTYTSKSDVWSYGVVLWEIQSDGVLPYAGMSGSEVVDRLRQGYRLDRPNNTSRDMYEIMWNCWNPNPDQRPTFADLVYKIGGLINLSLDYQEMVHIQINADNLPHHGNHPYPAPVFIFPGATKAEVEHKMEETPGRKAFAEFKDVGQRMNNLAMADLEEFEM